MGDPSPIRVFFDVTVGGEPVGRLTFQLRNDKVPKTAELSALEKKGFGYKNSKFHIIIARFAMRGGDIDDKGGKSIYGHVFDDENFELEHNAKGTLSMANRGPNTNGSQFMITLDPTPWLNNRQVAFGRIEDDCIGILEKLERVDTGDNFKPVKNVVIAECGELPSKE